MADAPKKLAIIDGKSVFYRGYYAMPNLSTKDGTPTGGVYGFAVMALEVLKRLKPDYVCVAWDKPKTNIRKRVEMYPAYKAGRKTPPPDFYEQIPVLHNLLEAFGWPLYELDDYEADDIMGALAVQATAQGIETQLITSDLDALQLVHPLVHVYALKKGLSNIELFRPETFVLKYGIKPEQFLDLKALKGDSSDNIPGVPGVGEKTALELLKQYETLDEIYENLPLLKETVRKKLEAGKDLAYLSKKLGAIWTDAPIKLDLTEVDGSKCDPLRVRDVLQKLEFRSLVRQLPEVMRVQETPEKAEVRLSGLKPISLKAVKTPNELENFEDKDTYFVHAHYEDSQVKHIALIGDTAEEGILITGEQLGQKAFQEAFAKLSSRYYENRVVGFDLKTLIKQYWQWGADMHPNAIFDVHIAAFMLNPLVRDHSIASLAREHLDLEIEAEEYSPTERLALELAVIKNVYAVFKSELQQEGKNKLWEVFQTIDMPVIPVLADMEKTGIKLDTGYLERMSGELADQISDIEQLIYGHADQEFNIGSPSQLADILFDKLNLPKAGIKRGKTGYSTAASELDKLRGVHPIIDLITQYREHTKLKNTYVDTLPKMVDDKSRLHTTFNLTIAQTGRLSSTDPNLQNIPVRTELGKRIRTAFVAEEGYTLVSADYSQFELRLAAMLCEDENLIDQFNRDIDVHAATAAQIYGRELEDVTKNMRRDAKVVNFGVMYGLGPHGLTVATGMTYDAAKKFIEKYFEVRPKLREYIESIREKASKDRYVETYFGRRRPTPDVHSSNFAVRESAMRAAVNMPFQGTAADLMKMAMIAVQDNLKGSKCRQLLQIHDSILVECPEAEAERTAKLLKDTMEGVYKLPIKLTVDTSIGKNWGEL